MEKERFLAIRVINEFEYFLDELDITLPSEDREGKPEEARIFGSLYYNLEDKITELLKKEGLLWKKK